MFLKNSAQTLIGTILRSLIQEYTVAIRGCDIRGPPPDGAWIESHLSNYCLVGTLGLAKSEKKKAMYDFISRHKKFLQSPFPENNLDNDHYRTFEEDLQPELNKIMHL